MKDTFKKMIYLFIAFLFLAIGASGAVLPVLPTTPFLLVSSFFFAKGSKKFNRWFLSTSLYKNHLESFIESRSMTLKTKARILTLSTTMLLIAIYIVDNTYIRIAIGSIMLYKYYYFKFNIETIKESRDKRAIARKVDAKKTREKEVVTKMINIYCRGNRHGGVTPCRDCKDLIYYANKRIDECPFMETKTFCSNCRVHCYKQDMREKIRAVMRYSGPRMIFYHPIMAIKHSIESKREIWGLRNT